MQGTSTPLSATLSEEARWRVERERCRWDCVWEEAWVNGSEDLVFIVLDGVCVVEHMNGLLTGVFGKEGVSMVCRGSVLGRTEAGCVVDLTAVVKVDL